MNSVIIIRMVKGCRNVVGHRCIDRIEALRPIQGQRDNGTIPADEDAILMQELFGLDDPLEDMSPVHIRRGFTKSFIRGEVVEYCSTQFRFADPSLAETAALLMITGGEKKEADRLHRADRRLIRDALLSAARTQAVAQAAISPGGELIAFTRVVPRTP